MLAIKAHKISILVPSKNQAVYLAKGNLKLRLMFNNLAPAIGAKITGDAPIIRNTRKRERDWCSDAHRIHACQFMTIGPKDLITRN